MEQMEDCSLPPMQPSTSASSVDASGSHQVTTTRTAIRDNKVKRDNIDTNSNNVTQNRHRLSKMLQFHGYSACREALILLEDHFNSSTKYTSMEDFISKLNLVITFESGASSSVIDSELAYRAIKILSRPKKETRAGGEGAASENGAQGAIIINESSNGIEDATLELPKDLPIKVRNVQYDPTNSRKSMGVKGTRFTSEQENEFNIHYNFLYKRLSSLPIFQGDFKLTSLETLTASSQNSIRCICFGLLVKDISKINGYMLIDNTGRVPVRITPDTTFRNRLAYTNCIVLIEGVYTNPDDVLHAANIGLPPILLDPLQDKSLACADEKLVVILKELYLDEEETCNALDMLFTGYNSMDDPPALFILIGDFTRTWCETSQFRVHMKKLIRILRACDNLKNCHFVFVPGQRDTSPEAEVTAQQTGAAAVNGSSSNYYNMPKSPLTREQLPLNLLELSGFNYVHLATNPTHVHLGERKISIVAHSYLKELRKNLLHDLSDHREELFETSRQIILSNAHLSAGIAKAYHSSLNLWHKPDLLVLADTEAFGNRYDFSSSSQKDTSFATIPSFSRQSSQFKVYYIKSGEIEDSQVSSDAYQDIEDVEESDNVSELIEHERSELD